MFQSSLGFYNFPVFLCRCDVRANPIPQGTSPHQPCGRLWGWRECQLGLSDWWWCGTGLQLPGTICSWQTSLLLWLWHTASPHCGPWYTYCKVCIAWLAPPPLPLCGVKHSVSINLEHKNKEGWEKTNHGLYLLKSNLLVLIITPCKPTIIQLLEDRPAFPVVSQIFYGTTWYQDRKFSRRIIFRQASFTTRKCIEINVKQWSFIICSYYHSVVQCMLTSQITLRKQVYTTVSWIWVYSQ